MQQGNQRRRERVTGGDSKGGCTSFWLKGEEAQARWKDGREDASSEKTRPGGPGGSGCPNEDRRWPAPLDHARRRGDWLFGESAGYTKQAV